VTKTTLRVIGGAWRNRRLAIVPGSRPTSERAREALFDILGEWIAGKRVLELYAGSGAVAIEALSRGAAAATAVEREPNALEENRRRLDAPVEVVRGTSVGAVRQFVRERRQFDLVFVDPPYDDSEPVAVGELASLLGGEGRVIWQSDVGGAPRPAEGLRVSRTERYGRNVFTFLEKA